jgi:IS30 family transposase
MPLFYHKSCKSKIAALTQRQLDKIVDKINNRPRKVLGYLTPYEVFRHKIRTSEKNPHIISSSIKVS